MDKKPYIVMALPCYNEAKNIGALLEQYIRLNEVYGNQFHTKVIVINDTSTDNTREVAESYLNKMDLKIINHDTNGGLTGGINTAINEFAKYLHYDNQPIAFALMDGDNSHSPFVIPQMVNKILQDYDVVIASRYQLGSRIEGVAYYRQVLSLGLGMLFKLLRNIPGVRDYSCGYRLYSPKIVKRLKDRYGDTIVLEKSFASMVEILVKCHLQKALCAEVPFFLRYDKKLGESKMPFKKTIIGNFNLLRALKR